MKWYQSKGSGGQGLIIEEETGRNVAVAYDEKDTPLLSAAPDLLEALKAAVAVFAEIDRKTPWSETEPGWWLEMNMKMQTARAAISKAEGRG